MRSILVGLVTVLLAFATIAMIFSITGCTDLSTDPASAGRVSLLMKYSTLSVTSSKAGVGRIFSAIDSIRITRSRFVLRDLRLHAESDSESFRMKPFVLDVNPDANEQTIALNNVPFRRYREVRFKVHRVEQEDLNGLSDSTLEQFADFMTGNRSSIIIEGSVFAGGLEESFIFRSRINEEQRISFNPELVVSESAPDVNVTMLLSSENWFQENGQLLDPRDSSSQQTIEDNLKASIDIFKDHNRDGYRD